MPYRRVGSSDRLSTTVRDASGNLADPDDIFLDILDPAKVETTNDYNPGPIVRDGTGLFHYNVANLTALGRYAWLYRTTGVAQGIADPRYFTLVSKWTPLLLTLEEAKSYVNSTLPDPDIELYVDSVTEWLEKKLGPVVARPATARRAVITESGDLYMPTMVVPDSITAATVNGTVVSVVGWVVDDLDLRLIRPALSQAATFRQWSTIYVTYAPGCDPMPAPLKEAAGLLVQSAYDNQRGPAGLPLAAEQDAAFGSSYPLALQARDKWQMYAAPSVA